MTGTSITSVALALAVGTTVANAAEIGWNVNSNGSWDVAGNWSPANVPGAADDVVLNKDVITTHRTLSLDGNRTINSLSAINHGSSAHVFTLAPGDPADSALTILSGDITADAGPNSGGNEWTVLRLGSASVNTPIIIGDGVTPVTDAEWRLETTGSNGNSRGRARLELGEVRAIEGTVITIKNLQNTSASTVGIGNALHLFQSNNDFLGKIVVDPGFRFAFYSAADNGLGKGTIEVNNESAFNFGLENQTEEANLVLNHTNGFTTFSIDTGSGSGADPRGSLTLKGNLSGTGSIEIGPRLSTSTLFTNTLIHDGDSTLSGNVTVKGALRINGTWSGTGDVLVYHMYSGNGASEPGRFALEGTGTLGLASEKTVTIRGNTHNTYGSFGQIAPGTNGTIGTLTIGTDNTNSVIFHDYSRLLIDIDGTSADQLIINGNLDLSRDADTLVFNILNAPSLGLYTLVSYTGSLSGEFNSVIGLPDGYSIDYSTNGQINLIPEPTAISLLGLGALGLLRRRRN